MGATELQAGAGLPRVAEPPQAGELGGGTPAGEHRERTAGVDRPALEVVPDQQHLRIRVAGLLDERGQRACVSQGCLVDDDELARGQAPVVLLNADTPLGLPGAADREVVRAGGLGSHGPRVALGAGVGALPDGLVQPLRGGLARDTQCLGEGVGGGGGRCQAEHGSAVGLPHRREGRERRGLARAGRSDERVEQMA
jgi:hypothetical protein